MAQTVRITYYGMDGEGRTVTEAKRDAGEKIEKALSGDYTPRIISGGHWAGLIWRSPVGGFQYRMLDLSKPEDLSKSNYCSCSGYNTMADVEKAVQLHLAQKVFDWSLESVDVALSLVEDRHDKSFITSWITFQYCYKAWRDNGADDTTAHRNACENRWPNGVEVWKYNGL